MGGEQQLERSILERKERDELQAIAAAMSLKPKSRARKADIIDQILLASGVSTDVGPPNGDGPNGNDPAVESPGAGSAAKVTRTRKKPSVAADSLREQESVSEEAVGAVASISRGGQIKAAPSASSDLDEEDGFFGSDSVSQPKLDLVVGAGTGGESISSTRAMASTGSGASEATAVKAVSNGSSNGAGSEGHGGDTDTMPRRQRGQRNGSQDGSNGARHSERADAQPGEGASRRSRRRRGRERGPVGREPQSSGNQDAQYQGEMVEVEGYLDIKDEGYGFLRTRGFLASSNDVYVSVSQVRRFGLRRGDFITGACRPAASNEKYPALLRVDSICGITPEEAQNRPKFEDLTPLFPDSPLRLEQKGDSGNMTSRIVDLISPIGKGQRGLIVSPPKAGKTSVLKQIAQSIESNNPEVVLIVLLVDERPEEVTDMRRSVKGEVIASTFDRPAEEHAAVAELAIEKARRLVELGKDVVIVLDGITRLARAYNLALPATGRIMSGGVDSGALYPPKKFFGAARNIEEGGSLTILATALVETGSRMDEVIFEEFKGTGNMELRLDRRLAERRIYPAIDVNASSTRHEELLFDRSQLQQVWKLRRVLNALAQDGSNAAGLELLIDKIKTTASNDEFLAEIAKGPTPSI